MKLPELDGMICGPEPGSIDHRTHPYILHNELIAMTFTKVHCLSLNDKDYIEKTYRYFLDKLNRGEL